MGMAARLIQGRAAATDPRGSAAQLLTIVRSLPDVIFQCEKRADGKIYWTLNEGKLAEEFHLTTDEVKGKPLEELFPPDVVAKLLPEFERAFRGEAHEFTNELFGRYFKHFPQPVFGPDGRVQYVVGFISEVTSLVRAEQQIFRLNEELAQRLEELAVSNKELEAFSYSVSHDLRTPLTAIDNHTQLLLERDGPSLAEPAKESLNRVRGAVKQMDGLISDILRLSRSATEKVAKESCDLGALARTIALEIQDADAQRKVEWAIADGAVAQADPRLMRVVLQNLLGNAWKYTAKARRPRIEFGMTTRDEHPVYFVRDNGAGFDMKDATRLFQAFTRLHSATDYPGSGVGLATVKRIVQRHGGRIWAEAEPDKGAAFYFTL